jgi:hypothetical protein
MQAATISATANIIATANVSAGNLNAVSLSLSGNVISEFVGQRDFWH